KPMGNLTVKRILASLLLLSTGCGTTVALRDNDRFPNQIYAGTRCSLHGACCAVGDVPFSMVADTIVLPYTIPRTAINLAMAHDQKPPALGDEKASPRNEVDRP